MRPRPGVQCYAASKGAVHVLAKSLALELAPFGVRVVAIAPVATETPMLPTFMGKDKVDDEGLARYRATVPLGRLNQPEDLARAALFLASDDAAMITGTRSRSMAAAASEPGARASGDDEMNVVPLAADSLGVRSMATYVECGETRILIDPGAALGAARFGLPPADDGVGGPAPGQ